MTVSPSGMTARSRREQPEKAKLPIWVTLAGKLTVVRPVQLRNALPPIFADAPEKVTVERAVQSSKAYSPMVTLPGMVRLFRPEHR